MNSGDDEWTPRCELAALRRPIAHLRMPDLIDTRISARVPGLKAHFLINRCGVRFDEMRALNLVTTGIGNRVDGNAEDAAAQRVNRATFTIHSAVQAARDVLIPLSQHALKFHGRLA